MKMWLFEESVDFPWILKKFVFLEFISYSRHLLRTNLHKFLQIHHIYENIVVNTTEGFPSGNGHHRSLIVHQRPTETWTEIFVGLVTRTHFGSAVQIGNTDSPSTNLSESDHLRTLECSAADGCHEADERAVQTQWLFLSNFGTRVRMGNVDPHS